MTDFPHGLTGYGLRCRCPECCAAKAEAWARYQPHRKRKPAAPQKRDKDRSNEWLRNHRADKRGFQAECDCPADKRTYHSKRYQRCTICLKYWKRPMLAELEKAA